MTDSTIYVPKYGNGRVAQVEMQPGESRVLVWDFTASLADGEQIATATFEVENDAYLGVSSPALVDGRKASARLTANEYARLGVVRCLAETDAGNTLAQDVAVVVTGVCRCWVTGQSSVSVSA